MADEETASEYSYDDVDEVAAHAERILAEQSARADANHQIDLQAKLADQERLQRNRNEMLQRNWDVAEDVNQVMRDGAEPIVVMPAELVDAARIAQRKPGDPDPPRCRDVINGLDAVNVNDMTVESPWADEVRPDVPLPEQILPDSTQESDQAGPSGVDEVVEEPQRPTTPICTGFGDECFPPREPKIVKPEQTDERTTPVAEDRPRSSAQLSEPPAEYIPPEVQPPEPPAEYIPPEVQPAEPMAEYIPREAPLSEPPADDIPPVVEPQQPDEDTEEVVHAVCCLTIAREEEEEEIVVGGFECSFESESMSIERDSVEMGSFTSEGESIQLQTLPRIVPSLPVVTASGSPQSSDAESFGHDCFKRSAPSQPQSSQRGRYPPRHKLSDWANPRRTQPAQQVQSPRRNDTPPFHRAAQSTPEEPRNRGQSRQSNNGAPPSRISSYNSSQPSAQNSYNYQRDHRGYLDDVRPQQPDLAYDDVRYIEGNREYAHVADVWEEQVIWMTTEPPNRRRVPDHLNSKFAPRGLPRYMMNAFDKQRHSMIETDYVICYSNGFISIGIIRDQAELRHQPVILQFGTWETTENRQMYIGCVVRVCEFAKAIQFPHGPKPAMHWNDSMNTRFIYKGFPVPAGLATKWHITFSPPLTRDLGYVTDFTLNTKSTSNYTNVRYWGRIYDQEVGCTTEVHDDHWAWYGTKIPHKQMGVVINWVHLEWPHLIFVDPDSKCNIPLPTYFETYVQKPKPKQSNAEYYVGWVDTRFPH